MEYQKGFVMSAHISPRPLTASFKAVAREAKASWGNKFIRDHYDLQYDASPESISNRVKQNKSKIKSRKPQTMTNSESVLPIKKYEYKPFKPREPMTSSSSAKHLCYISVQGLGSSNQLKGGKKIEEEAMSTATTLKKLITRDKASDKGDINPQAIQQETNLYGLSRFEFNKTVQGKMQVRSNHHIDFGKNSTKKIDNRNIVWYSQDAMPRDQSTNERANHHKIHSFGSYSAHKFFADTKKMHESNGSGWGGFLDKCYQTTSPQCMKITREDRMKQQIKYDKMQGRDPLQKKLGTNLNYDTQGYRTLQAGDGKRPLMQISQSPRHLVFSRQVISSSRGCFR